MHVCMADHYAMFPADEEITHLSVFPEIESRTLEFKQTIDVPFTKILPTICAFLNVGGGNILFGVKDNQEIVGIKTTEKRFDTFLLLIDNILHSNLIVATDGTHLEPDAILTRCIPWKHLHILVVTIRPVEGKQYQLKDGSTYHRLNASNLRISASVMYNESDVLLRMENAKKSIHDQYQLILRQIENKMLESQETIKRLKKDNEETITLLHTKILQDVEDHVPKPGFLHYFLCGLV